MKCSEGIAPPFSHADYCPGVYNCTELTGEEGYSPLVNDIWPSVVSIVSSSLSVLSSLLIIYTYVRWKDLRTGSRSIITFLAIADLVTASGYVMGAANYISHFGKREGSEACKVFQTLCEIQSFLTSTSSLSSFVWTSVLAVYLYLVIVKSKFILAKKLLPLYHIAAWLLPLFITLPLLVAGKLGYSSFAASNWCFIADKMPHTNLKEQCGHFDWEIFLFVLVGGKAWEILTYILVVVLYIAIKWDIYKKVSLYNVFFC